LIDIVWYLAALDLFTNKFAQDAPEELVTRV